MLFDCGTSAANPKNRGQNVMYGTLKASFALIPWLHAVKRSEVDPSLSVHVNCPGFVRETTWGVPEILGIGLTGTFAPLLRLARNCCTTPTFERDLKNAVKAGLREFRDSMSVITECTADKSLFNRLRMALWGPATSANVYAKLH